jgi:hypothetical protein
MDTKKFAMNYGTVLGLVLVAIAVIMWSVGADDKQSVIPALLNNGITIGFIAYAIIQYRDINNNGFISYAESLKLGTTVAFFSSIILAFYQFIYISYLDPNALSEIMKITEQAMLESNPEISDEELDMALQMTGKFMQPHWMMIMGVLGGTFMGFLWSIVILWFWGNWLLFEKANEEGWYSLIPLYSILVKLRIVGKPEWWILLYLVPLVNIIVHIIIINELRKCFRKDDMYTIALFFLGFIFQPRLGINNDEYISPNNSQSNNI